MRSFLRNWPVINLAAIEAVAMFIMSGCNSGPKPAHLVPGLDVSLEWIPPGTCLIGSTPEERAWAEGPEGMAPAKWFSDEGLQPRRVDFKKGFWMGRTELTIGQWRPFVEATGYRTEAEVQGAAYGFDPAAKRMDILPGKSWHDTNFPFPIRDDHPVSFVTWNDAVAFCTWLTGREQSAGRLPRGYVYRLPTEAEWEYACRGGAERAAFWWGDSLLDGQDRMNAASLDANEWAHWEKACPWSDGYLFISPVDTFGERGRNGFGLADMLGNVWEWCLDGYDPAAAHPTVFTNNPAKRVLRGGAFDDRPGFMRCAVRAAPKPDEPNCARGIRLCLGPAL